MEQSAWTDARLDDRFDHIDNQLGELRMDMRGLRGEVAELRSLMFRLHATTLVIMVGLFAALFARAG